MAFTPVQSLLGGICIGIGAAVALVVDGKIAGFSGIIGPFCRALAAGGSLSWNGQFLVGCVLGGLTNLAYNKDFAFPEASARSWPVWLLAGLCVGLGTRLGTGCTSGHGICGLARMSLRSLAAVGTFMAVGFASEIAFNHALATGPGFSIAPLELPDSMAFPLSCVVASAALAALAWLAPPLCPLVAGFDMGLGLGCAGMTSQAKVIAFLDAFGQWDPSLAFVMGGGLCISVPAFKWARTPGTEPSNSGMKFEQPPPNPNPDAKLILGSIIFGVGWALGGICPGPAIAGLLPNVVLSWHQGAGMMFAPFALVMCLSWLATDRLLARAAARSDPLRTPLAA